jgi:hypothetical protein
MLFDIYNTNVSTSALVPIFGKVLQPAHTNDPTYDQELLGVVCALKAWRCHAEGSARITIITTSPFATFPLKNR